MNSPQPQVRDETQLRSRSVRLIGMLEAVRRVIDEKFLSACELLSQAIEGLENLIDSLDSLAETLDEPTVAATTGDLRKAANKLLALPESHCRRVTQVGRLSKAREEFAERVSDMRCSLAYMRAFVANVKHDADGETGDRFATFVQGISGCIERGAEALKKLEFDLASLQLDLESATAKGEILAFQIDQLLPMVPDDLTTNAKVMGNHYLRVASTAGSVASIARDIHMRVSRILSALQIGDITRQRVEHIQAGVILLDTSSRALSGDTREQIMSSLYTLLASQISAASTDFHREVNEINQSMAAMAADARELLKLHDMAYGGVGTEGGFLRKTGDQIERALDLVGDVELTERQTIDTGRNTAAAAHELCSRLEALQTLKHGIGEAVEQAGGEAAETADVVERDLGEYVELLQTAADESMRIAGNLEQSAGSLVRGWEKSAEEDESEGSAAATALRVAAGRIREARDRTETDIASVVSKGDAVMSMLTLSSTRLDFHAAIGDILDAATAELTSLGKRSSPCKGDNTEQLESMLGRMAKFYSMAQERDVHRSFVTALGVKVQEPDPSEFGDDDFETVLF